MVRVGLVGGKVCGVFMNSFLYCVFSCCLFVAVGGRNRSMQEWTHASDWPGMPVWTGLLTITRCRAFRRTKALRVRRSQPRSREQEWRLNRAVALGGDSTNTARGGSAAPTSYGPMWRYDIAGWVLSGGYCQRLSSQLTTLRVLLSLINAPKVLNGI